jgi:hypothetical protein
MGNLSKSLTLILILIIAFSSLMMIKPSNAQSNPVIIVTPTPNPTNSPTPQSPTPTPTSNINLDYNQVSVDEGTENTTLVLAVKLTYNFGESVTLNYQDFILNIFRQRGGLAPPDMLLHSSNAKPFETGSVSVSSGNREADFELTFSFQTMQPGFEGPVKFSSYQLVYNGNVTIYTSPNPSPTVPEFSWLAILPLLLSLFSFALVFRHRKKIT